MAEFEDAGTDPATGRPTEPAAEKAGTETGTETETSSGGARSFGLTVLVGIGGAVLAAVAGNQPWVATADRETGSAAEASLRALTDASAPPVTATALVALAAWGVVLVSRGRWRRVVTWFGLLAAVTVLGFAVLVWLVAPDAVARDLPTLDIATHHTAWSYLGVLGGLLTAGASLAAVRGVGGWPEMGRRYDAPGTAPDVSDVPVEDQTNLDLWRAMDDGRDPTARERGDRP